MGVNGVNKKGYDPEDGNEYTARSSKLKTGGAHVTPNLISLSLSQFIINLFFLLAHRTIFIFGYRKRYKTHRYLINVNMLEASRLILFDFDKRDRIRTCIQIGLLDIFKEINNFFAN